MDVILLEKVQNLGKLGDRVAVRSGYARNYLLPQRKAVSATPANLAAFEQRRAELAPAAAAPLTAAQTRAAELNGKSVTIAAKAGTEGKLFGSVGTIDIAEAASRDGLDLKRHEVRLPSGNCTPTSTRASPSTSSPKDRQHSWAARRAVFAARRAGLPPARRQRFRRRSSFRD